LEEFFRNFITFITPVKIVMAFPITIYDGRIGKMVSAESVTLITTTTPMTWAAMSVVM